MTLLPSFYSPLVAAHPPGDVRALGWSSVESQRARFDVIMSVIRSIPSRVSMLDVGCGHGDLAKAFTWQVMSPLDGRYGWDRYTGIDARPEAISVARSRYPLGVFVVARLEDYGDESGVADVVVASGLLGHIDLGAPPYGTDVVEDILSPTLDRLYKLASIAAIFNCLSAHEAASRRRVDPTKLLEAALSVTPHVTLRCDYAGDDATVVLRKERA